MTAAKYTPGPWVVYDDPDNEHMRCITDETGTRVIASIDKVDGQDEANAALISVAPEMLAGLEKVWKLLSSYAINALGEEQGAIEVELQALIAKAKVIHAHN